MSSADRAAGENAEAQTACGESVVDLAALRHNYRLLQEKTPKAACGAAVKANAYGLGIGRVAPVLWEEGCRDFFVATPDEGAELRALLPEANIYVFNGLLPDWEAVFIDNRLIPVLNDPGQVARWQARGREEERPLPAILHVETGINRLGLTEAEVGTLADEPSALEGIDLRYIMSHLACAYDPDNAMNALQRETFERLRALLPETPASLCNSGGIFLGRDYHYDLTRPGISLYGGRPREDADNPMRPVSYLYGRILQIREIDAHQSVGYGATHRTEAPARIATLGVGYGDGYLRILGNRIHASLKGEPVPVVGRVSMDLITVDISDIRGEQCRVGDLVQLWGDQPAMDEVADAAETISYELITRLGPRLNWRYLDEAPA